MYLYLPQINTSTYRLDPTPETIALCDFILKNIEFDGAMSGTIDFQEDELYIDNFPIKGISFSGNNSYVNPQNVSGYKSQSYFFIESKSIYLSDGVYPKGTILVEDDD